jgi:hypothetical protein
MYPLKQGYRPVVEAGPVPAARGLERVAAEVRALGQQLDALSQLVEDGQAGTPPGPLAVSREVLDPLVTEVARLTALC